MDSTTFTILVALAAGRRNAAAIHDDLHGSASGRGVPVATFYRRLAAALEAGWIVGHEEAASGRGRPGRKYELTEIGTAAMRTEARRLQRLAGLALGDEASR